jgi:hypothetical protein
MVAKHQHQTATYNAAETQALRRILDSLHTDVAARLSANSAPVVGSGRS